MWFNSTQREEPYQVLTSCDGAGNSTFLRDAETGGAWLSSARVVRCWVKSRNERNPYGQLLRKRTLARLPLTKRRKVGMTSNHHALYDLGYTRTTMALNKEKQDREVEQNSETTSQFGLQAATRLHEVGIASNRGSACHGEYVPGPGRCCHGSFLCIRGFEQPSSEFQVLTAVFSAVPILQRTHAHVPLEVFSKEGSTGEV